MIRDKGWLNRRILAAKKELSTWPQWMRQTACFEGSLREDQEIKSTKGVEADDTHT